MKLLEICQYSFISIFPAIIIGVAINKLFIDYSKIYINNNYNISIKNIIKIIIEFALNFNNNFNNIFYRNIIVIINKLVKIVPFLFRFNDKYIPSLKGESNICISTGAGLFLFITQTTLVNNAKLLVNKYKSLNLSSII